MAKVVTVLRSGGDFEPWHVRALQRQIRRWAPAGTEFVCLSDVDVPGVDCIPLLHEWPGWWAKLELFRPDLGGDLLYTDLDNVILGPIDDLLTQDAVTFNTGKNNTPWTSLMYLPRGQRARVWGIFTGDPERAMTLFNDDVPPFGDAGLITACYLDAQRWETTLPGQVANIAYCRTPFGIRVPTPKPRVMLCHQPHRPWQLPIFQRLYEGEL